MEDVDTMEKIQFLLSQISLLVKKNNEILDVTGARFNMFQILGLSHYETMHSAILAAFLNPAGSHGLKESFLKIFLDIVQIENFDANKASVKTEVSVSDYGRIDILIESLGSAIIIENKIYAADQAEQLKRYNEYALHKYGEGRYSIIYLTLDGKCASSDSGDGVNYKCVSYKETILKWLERCVSAAARFPLVRETINQYINHLKQLTGQDMNTVFLAEMINLLSKAENIEAVLQIPAFIGAVKDHLLIKMIDAVAKECDMQGRLRTDLAEREFYFYKDTWKEGVSIYFGLDAGKIYYAIKTKESLLGNAIPNIHLVALFTGEPDTYNPYGREYIYEEDWLISTSLWVKIADGSFARECVAPHVKRVLEYLKSNRNIVE